MERLTPEQIRLLEELRGLRDSGILTIDEFELQVAKVLGRSLVVEPSPIDEELLTPAEAEGAVVADVSGEGIHEDHTVYDDVAFTPEISPESELLEYEFVEPETSDENEILAEENQVVESSSTSDIPAENIAEEQIQQNKSSRRKVLIGTTVGLILIVVIALVTLGGGKSDSTSSQIINSTTTVTQSTAAVTTQAPTTSTTTTTEVIPTTTYEVLQCPYSRVIKAIDGKIVAPEGITLGLRPATYKMKEVYGLPNWVYLREGNSDPAGVEVKNPTDLRLRIGMELEWTWPNGSLNVQWGPDNGRGFLNGFETKMIRVEDKSFYNDEPITDIQLKIVNATIKYLCP